MLQITGEISIHLLSAIWYGVFLSIAALIAITHRFAGKESQMQEQEKYNQDEHRINRRRLKGGVVYNDLLWEAKGEEERRMRQILTRLTEADTAPEDRRIYSEQVNICQRQIDRLYRLITMKDPDDD